MGRIIENIIPLFEKNRNDEAIDYLNEVIKKSFLPSTTIVAKAYLVSAYLRKNELDKARKLLYHWYVGRNVMLGMPRVLVALYDEDIDKAKVCYEKFSKTINTKLYGASKMEYIKLVNMCRKAINMCETKVFDEELYDEFTLDYAKELCLRYKKN